MKNRTVIITLFILFGLGIEFSVNAQTDKELLVSIVEEQKDAVNALVLYPSEIRDYIFEATQYPEALVKISSIQKRTSQSFRKLVENYPKEVQVELWDLTRYPGLIHGLADLQKKDYQRPLDDLLKEYPGIIHERSKAALKNYRSIIIEMDKLALAGESAFKEVIKKYPEKGQTALEKMIELPEVLSILTDNVKMMIMVGDVYNSDPEWIRRKADSLALEVARSMTIELDEWKEKVENDSQAINQLKSVAKEYTNDLGEDDLYYPGEEDEVETTIYYYEAYYPYWYGYPYWYTHPRWRPYPYWYDWGFYIQPDATVVVFGLPSYQFTSWYFQTHHNHYHCPYLSAFFVNHYHHYPHAYSSIAYGVTGWKNQHRTVISDNWLESDDRLEARFKELGQLEKDRAEYNEQHKLNPKSLPDFLEEEGRKYPTLSKSNAGTRDKPQLNKTPRTTKPQLNKTPRPKTEPTITTPRPTKPQLNKTPIPTTEPTITTPRPTTKPQLNKTPRPKTEPTITTPKLNPDTKSPPIYKQPQTPTSRDDINRGKSYHNNKWNTPTKPKMKVPEIKNKPKSGKKRDG